jgi:protocatechuate 3,4-dioxygenase alpha subunit
MVSKPELLRETPSQTAGPYVHIGLMPSLEGISGPNMPDLGADMLGGTTRGQRIVLAGRIFDGAGAPVSDAVIEAWQADADGHYGSADFPGWGRRATDSAGAFRFETIKPGAVAATDGELMAPHVTLWIVSRGINIGLHTRLYFADEAEANAHDAVLNRILDPQRRSTLIAERSEIAGAIVYTLDIRLQGEGETLFLDI